MTKQIKEILRNGTIISDVQTESEKGFNRKKTVSSEDKIYYIEMINGEVVEFKELDQKKQNRLNRNKKVAYNFLQRDSGRETAEEIILSIDKYYLEKLEKCNIDLVKKYITDNYNNYKEKSFIAQEHSDINNRIL